MNAALRDAERDFLCLGDSLAEGSQFELCGDFPLSAQSFEP